MQEVTPVNAVESRFLWGASTAAHQIEGGNTTSDWWLLEQSGLFPDRSGDACDSYHRYDEDIRLLAQAGLGAYRFSIEWARIEPEPGIFSAEALAHYRDMIDACRRFGVTPVVTLHHFTHPLWFALGGGWLREDAVALFERYVTRVSEILADVEWVVTINEPNILALMQELIANAMNRADGAVEEAESPTISMARLGGPNPDLAAVLGRAHRAAVEIIRQRTVAKVGWAIAAQAFTPTEGNELVFEEVFQRWEGAFYDYSAGDDFIGVQSYTSQSVDANGPVPHPESPDNTMTGWAYRPDALEINLRRIWERTMTPLLVTEHGIATADDARRIAYTTVGLQGISDAIADGVAVLGYLHWSLLDNFEWGHWAPTFGLIAVDRESFVRTPKPSLAWLGRVATGASTLDVALSGA